MAPYINFNNDENYIIQSNNQYRVYLNERIRQFKLIDNILLFENGILCNYSIIYVIMEIQAWFIELFPNKFQKIMKKYMLVTNSKLVNYTYNQIKEQRHMLDRITNDYNSLAKQLKIELIEYILYENSYPKVDNLHQLSIYDIIDLIWYI